MTDRELLELAAKAAGLKGATYDHQLQGMFVETGSDGVKFWSPLISDGDALRLAVKLRLAVHPDELAVEVGCLNRPGPFRRELCKNDPLAATRRAIVRAAAEIGKVKP